MRLGYPPSVSPPDGSAEQPMRKRLLAACLACHASGDALRGMIENRGGNARDARFVRAVLQKSIEGAVPGAANAKAQYRGVLTTKDLDDLSAYIAKARAS